MENRFATEIVEFCFNVELSDEECIRIIDSLERNFHSKQKGFVDTELLKGREGKWVMVQHWATMEDMKAVVKLMMQEPVTEEFRRVINPTTVKMQLLEQCGTWCK